MVLVRLFNIFKYSVHPKQKILNTLPQCTIIQGSNSAILSCLGDIILTSIELTRKLESSMFRVLVGEDVFVGFLRVKALRQRKKLSSGEEREYLVYKTTLPKEMVEKLGLKDGDLVLIMAKKPKWYHLLNWNDPEIQEKLWKHLSREAKKELIELGLAPKELLKC